MAKMTMREAISQALMEEMDRDPAVFILGEEVGVWGGTYAVTKGFYDKYGPARVKDTPIAENAIVGAAIGAAMVGTRPIASVRGNDVDVLSGKGVTDLHVSEDVEGGVGVGVVIVDPGLVGLPPGGQTGVGLQRQRQVTAAARPIPASSDLRDERW